MTMVSCHFRRAPPSSIKELAQGLCKRPTWLAMHIQSAEIELLVRVHQKISGQIPELRTIMVLGEPSQSQGLEKSLNDTYGLSVDLWKGPGGDYPGAY
jgi:hypothetical protein